VKSMGTAEFAILLELKLVRSILLILGSRIIPPLTPCTSQGDDVSHVYASSTAIPQAGRTLLSSRVGIEDELLDDI
jgi:hypothetical protein